MKKLLFLFSCLLAFCAYANNSSYPKIIMNGKEYYLYTVQKSEGFYAISQRFGVPQKVIIAANPNTENGLQLGQIIKIPVIENTAINNEKTEQVKPDFPVKSYTVRPKDTLYSLSKKYKVSVDDIVKVNPHAIKLNIGDKLYIPDSVAIKKLIKKEEAKIVKENKEKNKYDKLANQAFKNSSKDSIIVKDTLAIQNDSLDTSLGDDFEFDEIISKNYNGNFKVAILLPFMLQETKRDASMDRFVDFYKGCVIAADSLAKLGVNIDLYSFDIGKTHGQITSVLNNSILKEMDLIIGPAYQSQVEYLSKYASENKIRTVIPFASNVPDIKTNKYLYQVVSPQKEIYPILCEKFCEMFKDKYIIISLTNSVTTYNKSEFTDLLLPLLMKNQIEYTYINSDKIATNIDSIASSVDKEVIFLTPSSNEVLINKLGEQFEFVKSKNVSVFAFPEWNGYLIDELYTLPVYSFSTYHTDYNNDRTKRFFNLYVDKFGIPGTQQTPNYAIFGFDIFEFFLSNMNMYGKRFDKKLNDIESQGLQMNFAFKKQLIGGHSNTGFILQKIDSNGLNILN